MPDPKRLQCEKCGSWLKGEVVRGTQRGFIKPVYWIKVEPCKKCQK